MDSMSFVFKHPSNILIVGPTGAGKTQFLSKCLERGLFQPRPTRIIWIYGEWQETYDEALGMSKIGILAPIEFVKNEQDYTALYASLQRTERNLLILDDQMSETKGDNSVVNLVTKGSHHKSATVVFLMQNLFEKGGALRTINLNSQYLVLFKNPRDKRQISTLSQQMEPTNVHFIQDAFEDATRSPHSYLLFDLRQETPDELRVLTNVDSDSPRVYVKAGVSIKA